MSEALVILYVLATWIAFGTAFALVRRLRGRGPSELDAALEELSARYARAEMTREEYDRRRRELLAPR